MSTEVRENIMINQKLILARGIGEKAWQALLEEVYTTPKPGLVDLYSCGAHRDMNIVMFEKSARTLHPYFIQMAALGYDMDGTPEELFQKIRKIGLDAEQAMYRTTEGINTHKGLIFTLGIFCSAAGRCIREEGKITEKSLFDMEQRMVVRVLDKELNLLKKKGPESHGEMNLKRYGTTGIRGEAMNGYPSIRNIALPILRQGITEKKEWNLVKLQTLFHLMSEVEDSNIISRKNMQTLCQVHAEAKLFLKQGGAYIKGATERLQIMDADYIRRNISAGGCADLLAASIFVEYLLDTGNVRAYQKISGEKI